MIIKSLLENDWYTFTVAQFIYNNAKDVDVEYKFKCRNFKGKNLAKYKKEIEKEIYKLKTLSFQKEELMYLSKIETMKTTFILNYLAKNSIFKNVDKEVFISTNKTELEIKIKGKWLDTVWYEVPILAIINEIYFRHHKTKNDLKNAKEKLNTKIKLVLNHNNNGYKSGFYFADFGLRRRYSRSWQDFVIKTLKKKLSKNFKGTSNVYLAKKYKIPVCGTMSHQLLMAYQAIENIKDSQKIALDLWAKEFNGKNCIALSDTLGFKKFLKDFNLYFAKLYDGCRHDSGEPFIWCEQLLDHYKKLGINPRQKVAVFSDKLNFPLALDLHRVFGDEIITFFGIGTNLMNDVRKEPLEIVIKLIKVNNKPVAKVSDSSGKCMCEDKTYLEELKTYLKIKRD